MNNENFYSLNDLILLYYQDIEYLINILNANNIDLKDYIKYEEIIETLNKCYKKCVELGYYESENKENESN